MHAPWIIAAGLAAVLTLAGCAYMPIPTESLRSAQLAVERAEQTGVSEFAALELAEAREKLAQAHQAVEHDEMEQARLLAEESRVSAELALARAQAGKARQINQEIEESNRTLIEELERSQRGSVP